MDKFRDEWNNKCSHVDNVKTSKSNMMTLTFDSSEDYLSKQKNDESCKRWNRELQRRGVAIKATCLKHGVKHPNINDSAPIDEELVLFDDKDWYLVEAQVTDRSD